MALPANHPDVSNHRDIKGRALDWLTQPDSCCCSCRAGRGRPAGRALAWPQVRAVMKSQVRKRTRSVALKPSSAAAFTVGERHTLAKLSCGLKQYAAVLRG